MIAVAVTYGWKEQFLMVSVMFRKTVTSIYPTAMKPNLSLGGLLKTLLHIVIVLATAVVVLVLVGWPFKRLKNIIVADFRSPTLNSPLTEFAKYECCIEML